MQKLKPGENLDEVTEAENYKGSFFLACSVFFFFFLILPRMNLPQGGHTHSGLNLPLSVINHENGSVTSL